MFTSAMTSAAPAAATSPSAGARNPNNKIGKDEFLKIFVAQLKNQDPLSPMKGDEMAAQLAQFSTLEQLVNMNSQFGQLIQSNVQNSYIMNANLAQGLIGRTIVAEGNTFTATGESLPDLSLDVGASGGQGVLTVYDVHGTPVYTRNLGALDAGRQSVSLDGATLGAGEYTYKVDIKDAEGVSVPVTTYATLLVSGVQFGSDGFMLVAGSQRVSLGDVVEIATPRS